MLGGPPGDGPRLLQSCRDVCSVTTALLSLLGKCKDVAQFLAHSQLSAWHRCNYNTYFIACQYFNLSDTLSPRATEQP